MEFIDDVILTNHAGKEEYKFVASFPERINVYHYTTYKTSLSGKLVEGWLCCSEGWHLKSDGKWHETVRCGFKQGRVADTVEDIIQFYSTSL